MTRNEYKQCIESRVKELSNYTQDEYRVNFAGHYGGWNMYVLNDLAGHNHNDFGFDLRKSNAEMINYLDGILEVFGKFKVQKKP